MTPVEALKNILELAYIGHPEGRETRLVMIARYAHQALVDADVIEDEHVRP